MCAKKGMLEEARFLSDYFNISPWGAVYCN